MQSTIEAHEAAPAKGSTMASGSLAKAVGSAVYSFTNVTHKTPKKQQENENENGVTISTIFDDDSIELPTYDWSKSEQLDGPSEKENERAVSKEESAVGFESSENKGM